MNNHGALFSSSMTHWSTPADLFSALDEEFGFTLDVCADNDNFKTPLYFTEEDDGLLQSWRKETCWMNPPYGDPEKPCKPRCKKKRCRDRGHHNEEYAPGIVDWMKKAVSEWQSAKATVVCLIPARTDTAWWHEYVMQADEIRLIRSRLKYTLDGKTKASAPFPSAIVIYRRLTPWRRLLRVLRLHRGSPLLKTASALGTKGGSASHKSATSVR